MQTASSDSGTQALVAARGHRCAWRQLGIAPLMLWLSLQSQPGWRDEHWRVEVVWAGAVGDDGRCWNGFPFRRLGLLVTP